MKRNRRLIEFTKKGSNFKTKFLKTKWPTKKKERNSESLEAMTQCFYKKKKNCHRFALQAPENIQRWKKNKWMREREREKNGRQNKKKKK